MNITNQTECPLFMKIVLLHMIIKGRAGLSYVWVLNWEWETGCDEASRFNSAFEKLI